MTPGHGHTIDATGGHPPAPRRMARREPGTHPAAAAATSARPVMLRGIIDGHPGPVTITAAVPLAAASAGPRRVDAGGTLLRLRALHVMGHGSARIARAAGASEQAIQKITRGQTATVQPGLRDAITTVYDAWWDKRAPGRAPGERAAATRARRRAATGNWCAGAGLDDDQLDLPGYQPAHGWLPATGTGTAGDIGPNRYQEAAS